VTHSLRVHGGKKKGDRTGIDDSHDRRPLRSHVVQDRRQVFGQLLPGRYRIQRNRIGCTRTAPVEINDPACAPEPSDEVGTEGDLP
jgi:hypothetical protein